MQYIVYIFFRINKFIFSIIPFRLLYLFSDAFSLLLQYIVRYRRTIIITNLEKSFPEKSKDSIQLIINKFYKYLSDVFVESIKGYSLSKKQSLKRYQCVNPEVATRYFEKGKDIIIAMSHYGNWEWGTQVASSIYQHTPVTFYTPISNKYIDQYVKRLRMRQGMILTSIYETKFRFRSKERPKAYFLVSDQRPGNVKKALWIDFLNHDTPCSRGIENYAKLFDLPVIYLDVQRVNRGYYTVKMHELCVNPILSEPGEITLLYMKMLEDIIIKKPEYWLWSHHRWKKTRVINNI